MSYCHHNIWLVESDGSKTCRNCGENSGDGIDYAEIAELDYDRAEEVLGLRCNLVLYQDWRGFVIDLPIDLADEQALQGRCGHQQDIFKCTECERVTA